MAIPLLESCSKVKYKPIHCLTLIFIVFLLSCSKHSDIKTWSLILTGIKSAKGSEMVSVKIDFGVINTTPVACYIFSSTVVDPTTGGYGYVDCDTLFRLINPIMGEEIKSFRVPWGFSQTVITGNLLIGRYTTIIYEGGTGAPIYTNYVLTLDIETGTKIAENQVNLGDGAWACSYYYDSDNS